MRSDSARAIHDERAYEGPERRTRDSHPDEVDPVVLTHKYAEMIDGIDLAGREIGDRLPLPSREAGMLIAEGWAQPIPLEQRRSTADQTQPRS